MLPRLFPRSVRANLAHVHFHILLFVWDFDKIFLVNCVLVNALPRFIRDRAAGHCVWQVAVSVHANSHLYQHPARTIGSMHSGIRRIPESQVRYSRIIKIPY